MRQLNNSILTLFFGLAIFSADPFINPAHATSSEEIYLKKKVKNLEKTYGENAFVEKLSDDQVAIKNLMKELLTQKKTPDEIQKAIEKLKAQQKERNERKAAEERLKNYRDELRRELETVQSNPELKKWVAQVILSKILKGNKIYSNYQDIIENNYSWLAPSYSQLAATLGSIRTELADLGAEGAPSATIATPDSKRAQDFRIEKIETELQRIPQLLATIDDLEKNIDPERSFNSAAALATSQSTLNRTELLQQASRISRAEAWQKILKQRKTEARQERLHRFKSFLVYLGILKKEEPTEKSENQAKPKPEPSQNSRGQFAYGSFPAPKPLTEEQIAELKRREAERKRAHENYRGALVAALEALGDPGNLYENVKYKLLNSLSQDYIDYPVRLENIANYVERNLETLLPLYAQLAQHQTHLSQALQKFQTMIKQGRYRSRELRTRIERLLTLRTELKTQLDEIRNSERRVGFSALSPGTKISPDQAFQLNPQVEIHRAVQTLESPIFEELDDYLKKALITSPLRFFKRVGSSLHEASERAHMRHEGLKEERAEQRAEWIRENLALLAVCSHELLPLLDDLDRSLNTLLEQPDLDSMPSVSFYEQTRSLNQIYANAMTQLRRMKRIEKEIAHQIESHPELAAIANPVLERTASDRALLIQRGAGVKKSPAWLSYRQLLKKIKKKKNQERLLFAAGVVAAPVILPYAAAEKSIQQMRNYRTRYAQIKATVRRLEEDPSTPALLLDSAQRLFSDLPAVGSNQGPLNHFEGQLDRLVIARSRGFFEIQTKLKDLLHLDDLLATPDRINTGFRQIDWTDPGNINAVYELETVLTTLRLFESHPSEKIESAVESKLGEIVDFRVLRSLAQKALREIRAYHFREKTKRVQNRVREMVSNTQHTLSTPYRAGVRLKKEREWDRHFTRFANSQDVRIQEIFARLREERAHEPAAKETSAQLQSLMETLKDADFIQKYTSSFYSPHPQIMRHLVTQTLARTLGKKPSQEAEACDQAHTEINRAAGNYMCATEGHRARLLELHQFIEFESQSEESAELRFVKKLQSLILNDLKRVLKSVGQVEVTPLSELERKAQTHAEDDSDDAFGVDLDAVDDPLSLMIREAKAELGRLRKGKSTGEATVESELFNRFYRYALLKELRIARRLQSRKTKERSFETEDSLVNRAKRTATKKVQNTQTKLKEKLRSEIKAAATRDNRRLEGAEKKMDRIYSAFYDRVISIHPEKKAEVKPLAWLQDASDEKNQEELMLDLDYYEFIENHKPSSIPTLGLVTSEGKAGTEEEFIELPATDQESKNFFKQHYVHLPRTPNLTPDQEPTCLVCHDEVEYDWAPLSRYIAVPPRADRMVQVPKGDNSHKLSPCGHLIHLDCAEGLQSNRGLATYKCPRCQKPLPYREFDPTTWKNKYGFNWNSSRSK